MASQKPLTDDDGEVREWTEEDFARAKPFSDLPESLQQKLLALQNSSARSHASSRKPIHVRISRKVLNQLESTGSDWPLHVEEALRDWLARHGTQRKAAS